MSDKCSIEDYIVIVLLPPSHHDTATALCPVNSVFRLIVSSVCVVLLVYFTYCLSCHMGCDFILYFIL